jgi:hypothetical protein
MYAVFISATCPFWNLQAHFELPSNLRQGKISLDLDQHPLNVHEGQKGQCFSVLPPT